MNIKEHIQELKRKIRSQQNDCPTPILLCIAARWNYHSDVNPWYQQIKKLTGGLSKDTYQFHAAVVRGMYPEIKPASTYFREKADKFLKANRSDSVMEIRSKKYKRKIKSGLQAIENETIQKYGLKPSYDIYNLTDKQQKNIKHELTKTQNNLINKTISECCPVVQTLANALRHSAIQENDHPLAFSGTMEFLNRRLLNGKEKNTPPHYDRGNSVAIYRIADEIFKMQDTGIIDEKFNIVDRQAFMNSELLKKISYLGRSYNIIDKINSQHLQKKQAVTQR